MFSEGVLLGPDTRYITPNLFFRIRYSPLQDVGNSGKNLFIHAQVGNKNVHDVIHGKLQAEGGKMSRLG